MVPSLFPFLPHVATTFPSSLLPRSLLRRTSLLSSSTRLSDIVSQILLSATVFDFLTSKLKSRVRLQAVGVIVFITVYTFWYFSPLTYAGKWTRSQCESAKWMKNWDFSWSVFSLPFTILC